MNLGRFPQVCRSLTGQEEKPPVGRGEQQVSEGRCLDIGQVMVVTRPQPPALVVRAGGTSTLDRPHITPQLEETAQLEEDEKAFLLCSRPLHPNSQKERAKHHLNTI